MKIKILKTTAADGRFVRAGSIVDLSDKDAKLLIEIGKGIAVTDIQPELPAEPLTTEVAPEVAPTRLRKANPARGKHGSF